MALVLGWLVADLPIMIAVARRGGGDLVICLVVLLLWVVNVALCVCYAFFILSRGADPPTGVQRLLARLGQLRWAVIAIFVGAPGVWIGLLARSPLIVAVASLLAFDVVWLVGRKASPRIHFDPIVVPEQVRLVIARAVMMLAAVAVGIGIRRLLHFP